MQIGIITTALFDRDLEYTLDTVKSLGITHVEIAAAGGFWPDRHLDPLKVVNDERRIARVREMFAERELTLSAISIHGNPLDPDPTVAENYRQQYLATCALAPKLGTDRISLLAGLPGAGPNDENPNWITFPFPPKLAEALKWQWNERVFPYWQEAAPHAEAEGVKLCFEMVPNDTIYNPETLLKLRNEIGDVVGANYDPSHFLFQQIDPLEAVRALEGTIYNVHAKDVRANQHILRVRGVLDTTSLGVTSERSWAYRTLGWGSGSEYWTALITQLRISGYDGVLAIEHEDSLLSADEGLRKAIDFLKPLVPRDPMQGDWTSAL
ncbi:sugar phosphate isomerase/epimerase family protein [Gulosibacter chungangensis]|uniref:Sugar phosphate isomerase/epimerase n=1 Tax=Gulosibacter chungangensis TaxID=979746 RepID=A0A7J5B9S3_9MICO|nr:sugar phosphate isomerase/epimerase [Gulosibacter chungangensis]KAB1642315.1 sugar phosphate isomerase/epimerase [Gulosibacter chungangensis]